jgi:hypothetical protein
MATKIIKVDNSYKIIKVGGVIFAEGVDLKVSKTGDTIQGVFTNSLPLTQIILDGTNSGDNADGTPNFNSSPRLELSTYQISEYRSGETQKGGYSELVRLVAKDTQAKPTLAYYDHNYKPVAWIVSHFQPQDLRIYANLAAFPVTGVDDGLRAYYATDTGLYYTWNGSAYVQLLPTNSQYYYRAIHQHISFETADTTGSANYTRLGIPYGLDVVPITTANSHVKISNGTKDGKPFGALVVDEGKIFSVSDIILYPDSSNAGNVELWKDSPTDNIFANNTEGVRFRVLASGSADNLVSGQKMLAINAEGLNWIGFNENVVIGGSSNYSLGINRSAGVTLDVRRADLGVANNTEYTIQRISRDESSFLNIGYRGDGTGVGSYMIRPTGSKSLVLGTTGSNTALTINGTTGAITAAVEVVSPKARASSSAGLIIEANNGTDVADFGAGNTANSTFYGAVQVPDDAYDATSWNGNTTVPTKNAVRDKIEVIPTETATFINKRVTPRTGTVASSATPTINTDNIDFYSITALAVDITSMTTNLSGTPTDGQRLWIAITGTGARTITWGASFEASTIVLPIVTVLTNRLDVEFIWNAATSKWRCVRAI